MARLANESTASACVCSHYSWLFHGRWESNCGPSGLYSDGLTYLPQHLTGSPFTFIMMAANHCVALGAIRCFDACIHCYNIKIWVLIVYLPTLILLFIEVNIQNPLPQLRSSGAQCNIQLFPDLPL